MLRWVFTLALLAIVATQVDFQVLARALGEMRWSLLALAAVGVFADRVLATFRWWLLLRVKGIDLGFLSLLNLHLAASFIGSFLPTSFGADAARILMLSKRTGRTIETVAASTVDRLAMIGTTLAAALVACVVFINVHLPVELRWTVVLIGSAALVCAAALLLICNWGSMRAGVRRLLGDRLGATLARLYRSINDYRHNTAALTQAAAISVLMLALRALVLVWMAGALAVSIGVIDAVAIWPIAAVIFMLPISVGNFGLQEGTYVALLGVLGVSATMAVSISLLDHVVTRVVVVPGALIWMLGSTRSTPGVTSQATHAIDANHIDA